MKKVICLLFCLSVGLANAALTVVDDFNNNMTDGWTIQNGTIIEADGFVSGTSGSLMTMNGLTSNSIGVDATGLTYVALVLNYSSLTDNLFIKIQDNNGNNLYDMLFFYHGNNGDSAVLDGDRVFLAYEVPSSYFQVTDNGDGTISAFVAATGETFNRTLKHTYDGTGVGLGFWGDAKADNFYAVPEPTTLFLFALGTILVRRKRR